MRKSEDGEVALVFHGELKSMKGATFTNTAYQDNYNSKSKDIQPITT